MKKPPIGTAPAWYIYPKRMKDISEAIDRYVGSIIDDKALISREDYLRRLIVIEDWSRELAALTHLYLSIEEQNE